MSEHTNVECVFRSSDTLFCQPVGVKKAIPGFSYLPLLRKISTSSVEFCFTSIIVNCESSSRRFHCAGRPLTNS